MIPLTMTAAGIGALALKSWYETKTLDTTKFSFQTAQGGKTQKIAFLSDIHFRKDHHVSNLLVKQCAEQIEQWNPDVIVFGGDYVTRWTEASPETVYQGLLPLSTHRIPSIAILGNHDYYEGQPEQLFDVFSRLNITLLRNQDVTINDVTYIGLDSSHQENDTPESVLNCDAQGRRIIIWHEPDAVDRLKVACADLMLAGHTHGGQVLNPWGWGELSSKNGKRYNRGIFRNTVVPLYVTRGIGTVGVHARLFTPPELTLLTLD